MLIGGRTVWGWGRNNIGRVTEAVAGFQTTLVLINDSTVLARSSYNYEQLGNNLLIAQTALAKINSLYDVFSINAGQYHSLDIKDDGTVWAWGINNWGQLGDGTTADKHEPIDIPNLNLFD